MNGWSEQQLLDELADRYGVARDYFDNWGRRHWTSEESKRAILTAMGVRAESRDDLRRALADTEDGLWHRPCDPVMVRRADAGPGTWSFRLPAEEGEDHEVVIAWEVRDEAGSIRRQGEAGPGLVPVETHALEGRRQIRLELTLPADLPIGYYNLRAQAVMPIRSVEGCMRLILVPPHCYVPPRFHEDRRTWGLSLHLYALRSSRNWGVGDFGDLAALTEWAAKELGAGLIGLNPLHALKNARPYHISPYSPDSRLFLNPLYVDVERMPDFSDSEPAQRMVQDSGFQSWLEVLRKSETVDYDQVSAAKRAVLEAIFATFQERHLASRGWSLKPRTARGRAFARYVRDEGDSLENFALFQVLAEEFRREEPSVWVWQEWPEAYRHPESAAVAAFRIAHPDRVRFHQYLQWAAREQLENVARQARALGMPLGLYHDLALASDRCGSDSWMFQDLFAPGADAGCPPDAFALGGQNWGLPPVNPVRLRETGYRMFSELLRRNLQCGGALRLDHVMGLFRLFWIPRGRPASAGAYVRYPAEDLLGILALESVRHRAVIVGEDLGTVPDEVRERLAAARVLSYRVFYFERRHDGGWKPPGVYPSQAMAVVTTHDLATLPGFWAAEDIEVRSKLGVYPDAAAWRRALEERQRDKGLVLRALKAEGLLPGGLADDPALVPEMTVELCCAIHAYLARTPSWIVLAALEDALGELAQKNVPGTLDSYPNWSRKSALPLEELQVDAGLHRLAAVLRGLRPLD